LIICCLLLCCIGQINAQTSHDSKSLNSYSFDLYRLTKVKNENLFLSPLSTYYALLLAYEGSSGKTKQEFKKVLYLENSEVLENGLLQNIAGPRDSYSGFNAYNAIWLDNRLNVKRQYRKAVSDKYFSDLKQTNFKNVQSSVLAINGWVTEKTNRKVNKIVSAENLDKDTRLVISNAVYFKGEWLNKFKKRYTHPSTFYSNAESLYTTNFMQQKEIVQYFENDELQFIAKPYKSSNLSFCILLPKKLFGIRKFEEKLNNRFLNDIIDQSAYAKILLYIPKFKMEWGSDLADALKIAGLKSAFSSEADFSGITKAKPLNLGSVLHKTWLELDEEKTEAAAATAVITVVGAGKLDAFKVFNADHPFVFFILDNRTRTILFMGRYVIPLQGEKIVEDKEKLAGKVGYRKGEPFSRGDQSREILYIVDDKVVSEDEFKAIKPENIETINVFSESSEISKYSSKDFIGVVKVTLK